MDYCFRMLCLFCSLPHKQIQRVGLKIVSRKLSVFMLLVHLLIVYKMLFMIYEIFFLHFLKRHGFNNSVCFLWLNTWRAQKTTNYCNNTWDATVCLVQRTPWLISTGEVQRLRGDVLRLGITLILIVVQCWGTRWSVWETQTATKKWSLWNSRNCRTISFCYGHLSYSLFCVSGADKV